jgi:predicted alpha/beta-hydrolase family hydrolase
MVVVHRQQVSLAFLQPTLGRTGLALGAMPVAAGVVGNLVMTTAVAVQHVSPQCRAAALFDSRHDFELTQALVSQLALAPSRAMSAKDVGDLQGEA